MQSCQIERVDHRANNALKPFNLLTIIMKQLLLLLKSVVSERLQYVQEGRKSSITWMYCGKNNKTQYK